MHTHSNIYVRPTLMIERNELSSSLMHSFLQCCWTFVRYPPKKINKTSAIWHSHIVVTKTRVLLQVAKDGPSSPLVCSHLFCCWVLHKATNQITPQGKRSNNEHREEFMAIKWIYFSVFSVSVFRLTKLIMYFINCLTKSVTSII